MEDTIAIRREVDADNSCLFSSIAYLIDRKNFNESDSISVKKISLNNYIVKNFSNDTLKYIFPINNIYNKWETKDAKFYSKKGFLFVELPPKSSTEIFYNNSKSKNLRKINFYTIILLLLIISITDLFYFLKKKLFC